MHIERHVSEGILVLEFANPPLNTLSVGNGLVGELLASVSDAIADSTVEAIILTGAGGNFCAGADIKDFDGPEGQIGLLRELLDRVESSPKPVIAAIDGFCFGGGLELALAAHHRIATHDARFAFPEINLGLLPGAGGTQRAPRLAGAARALGLMLDGKPIKAEAAVAMGLVDRLSDGDPVEAGKPLFQSGEFGLPRRASELPPPADLADAIAEAREKGLPTEAARQIVACVEAIASRSFAEGLALEAERFAALMASTESKALRHGFFGRRTVRNLPGVPKGTGQQVERVTIIGGGLMGTGIALAVLSAGLPVALVEPREDGREKARDAIARTIVRNVHKGRLSEEAADRQLGALRIVGKLSEASDADLFIEAVFEDMAVKRQVFEELDRLAGPNAILGSNTSTLDLDAIAACTSRPERVVGLHFFSPANIMRLLEVVRGAKTSPDVLQSAMGFAKALGKTAVVAGNCDGFIGNRIFEEYLRQAWFLLEEGALPTQVDQALEKFGFAMGPCRVMDLAGQDIGWSIRKRRAVEQPDRPYSKIPDQVCKLGRFGQKTGAGMYLYPDGRTPEPDPAITDLIIAESGRLGIERRTIADSEIVERCVLAMVNEGARILEEGVAYRPVDIDVVFLDGYGFPALRGGPMFYADTLGLDTVLARIRHYADQRHGWAWEPSPLLVKLAESGGTFSELNAK
ncbi:3-hydroxyacyl-CoA dehydrogenase NAD-binding domain-containing protein [Alteraurantiacibacter aquimixticola]|uniref:3-hydroxyacyl-CoA dehydrogenase n=1 Tax=Alteraurantiacibacter aquimixticola TaxID=2489173 RepID=A0A4T3F378_9SPHN|nr:3-hydroxyacyl-CoA dehydrogenase NAD-binding domain-containing protein [Alteraurantiacibacter aquimixticola]TIX51716.1 3-hydroxyacyl-CoA dehydrogenase [Alteraurantiacibacter aquimixticola]